MEAVPLTLFLARKGQDKVEDASGGVNRVDIQAAADAWYQKGLIEGKESAKQILDAALARKDEEHKFRIDLARKIWAETEGARLAQQTMDAIEAMKVEIEETIARVLKPLVEKRLVEEALAKLAIEIGRLLSDDDAIRLRICGPADLVSQLTSRIAPNVSITVADGDQPELTVLANKTIIETRLTEWLAHIGVQSYAQEQQREREE
jgi:hypothetical protein